MPGKDKGKPAGKHKDLPSPTQGLTADAHKIGAHEAPGASSAIS